MKKFIFDLDVIEAMKANSDEVAPECVVDTTTATDWRFRDGIWRGLGVAHSCLRISSKSTDR